MYAIIFHAHQKLDRVAHKRLDQVLSGSFFPCSKQITHFEAANGPDGARLKRQSKGEQPWHFVDPHDPRDTQLHKDLQFHYDELVASLKKKDDVQSSFHAAWLAHALVDGLTPAHHYPYEEELAQLRGTERHNRKGLTGRLYIKGDTVWQSVGKSLKLVGPKGLLTTHALFEAGAYTIIAPLRLKKAVPSKAELKLICDKGVVMVFQGLAKEVASFDIYHRFIDRGWTHGVTRDVRKELAPRMVKMITMAWYAAAQEAKT